MILAEVHTGHYQWTVLAEDQGQANRALLAAYEVHVEQHYPGFCDPNLMSTLVADGGVEYSSITPGVALRDGEPVKTQEV